MKKITYKDVGNEVASMCFCCQSRKPPLIRFVTTIDKIAKSNGTYCLSCLKKERYGVIGTKAEAFDDAIREYGSG